jgi:hypothetical protein
VNDSPCQMCLMMCARRTHRSRTVEECVCAGRTAADSLSDVGGRDGAGKRSRVPQSRVARDRGPEGTPQRCAPAGGIRGASASATSCCNLYSFLYIQRNGPQQWLQNGLASNGFRVPVNPKSGSIRACSLQMVPVPAILEQVDRVGDSAVSSDERHPLPRHDGAVVGRDGACHVMVARGGRVADGKHHPR